MVAIKNAVVPPSCYFCPMTNDGFYLCKANNPYRQLEDDCEERRPAWCPLVELPPHGRLIDADALIAKLNMMIAMAFGEGNTAFHFAYRSLGKVVENAPTIIEAEEGK